MSLVIRPTLAHAPARPRLTNEQIHQVPLLLGVIEHMGIRAMMDAPGTPHGAWHGARVGTVVSLWLCHFVAERNQRLVAVRDGVAQRTTPFNTLLALTWRDTEVTDDRLANVLPMLSAAPTPARLAAALLQRWRRVYPLPTATVRLDSTSVRVSHDPTTDASLLHQGHRKDHRPAWRQGKAMLASLAPLGLPLVGQPVAGNRADDGWYVPAYQAAGTALGTAAVLVVGDSQMGARAPRGPMGAGGSASLCASRPPAATEDLPLWREQALQRARTWQCLETVDPQTGAVLSEVIRDEWSRQQHWEEPGTQKTATWSERVLVTRSSASQAGLQRRRARALPRLPEALVALWLPPPQGRNRYRDRQALARTVAARLANAGLTGVVQVRLSEETLPDETTRWVGTAVGVNLPCWQALVERLRGQGYVTSTTTAQSRATALGAAYQQPIVQERGWSRLKTRHLHIRPVYLGSQEQ